MCGVMGGWARWVFEVSMKPAPSRVMSDSWLLISLHPTPKSINNTKQTLPKPSFSQTLKTVI